MRCRTDYSCGRTFIRCSNRGYVTVTPEYHVEVSSRIRDEFHNGKEYYALHGATIRLPANANDRPGGDFLGWHNENVFKP